MTDLIIIGAGPGGCKTALHAARHGLKVTLFEQHHVGGTCLNVGCIPTKTYLHSSTLGEATARRRQVVEQLRTGLEALLSQPGITLVREHASFVDAHTVATPGGRHYAARAVVIATGSTARRIPVEGAHDPCVVDSTGLLDLEQLPRRLCIIGAGVVGMEFASAFRRFGSEVTVVEYLSECLPALDGDVARRLRKAMERQGIGFRMQRAVSRIAGGTVYFTNRKGQDESAAADAVLMATGRAANTGGLNLAAAGIAARHDGTIPVNDHFEVILPHAAAAQGTLFAIGDVNGRHMLAHAAEYQARHVVDRLTGNPGHIRFDAMPAAIFTTPEAACVGPAEQRLREAGEPHECHKAFFRANGKALAMGQTEGMVKLCCQPGEGRLLSCHACGAHAADIVQEATAYVTLGATLRQLRETIHIHPTLAEVLTEDN